MAQTAPSVGKSFSESFSLFLRHFPVLAGLYFIAAIISIAINIAIPFATSYEKILNSGGDIASSFQSAYEFLSLFSVSQFLGFIITVLIHTVFIQYILSIYQKEPVTWRKNIVTGLKKLFLIVLLVFLLVAFAVVGYLAIILVGALFAFIPVIGIYIFTLVLIAYVVLLIIFFLRASFAVHGIVLENLNPISALTRSFHLTKGFSGRIFLFYAIYILLAIILLVGLYGLLFSFMGNAILMTVTAILVYGGIIFFQSWLETAKMTVFLQVKQFRENFGLEKLVSAFNEPEQKAEDDGISGN